MMPMQATAVRKEWSSVCDVVAHEKPQLVKRTHDELLMIGMKDLRDILELATLSATVYEENDGSITLSMDNLDLIENGETMGVAKANLSKALLDYSNEYYDNFKAYSNAPNRHPHLPYIMRVLMINDVEEIERVIVCHVGQN